LETGDVKKSLSTKKIIIPIFLGLLVAVWMLYSQFNKTRFVKAVDGKGNYEWVDTNLDKIVGLDDETEFILVDLGKGAYKQKSIREILNEIQWSKNAPFWIFIALMMMVVRDVAYMYRIRVLTDKALSWRNSFNVIMLWEFASALTPSVVGGSSIAMFILHREGINLGKSTAIVMVTALLDELFYVITVPIVFLVIGYQRLFPDAMIQDGISRGFGIEALFIAGYLFILLLVLIISLSIFWRPALFKKVLTRIFSISFLKRWRKKIIQLGNDIITTSIELKGKKISFWIKSFGATVFSWTARFWVVNFIMLAFFDVNDHLLVYGKQLVMWVIMLISPTPGSSGVAEYAFTTFLKDTFPLENAGILIILIALIWRLMSYYTYLFVGAIILPKWLNKKPELKA
jgi:hypothetical protein